MCSLVHCRHSTRCPLQRRPPAPEQIESEIMCTLLGTSITSNTHFHFSSNALVRLPYHHGWRFLGGPCHTLRVLPMCVWIKCLRRCGVAHCAVFEKKHATGQIRRELSGHAGRASQVARAPDSLCRSGCRICAPPLVGLGRGAPPLSRVGQTSMVDLAMPTEIGDLDPEALARGTTRCRR